MTTTNNTSEVHGHEVLHMVRDAATPHTRATLVAEIERRFGPNARFCTCSAGGMTLDGLLAFLMARGKIVEQNGRLAIDASKICNHGDGEHHH